MTPDKKINPIFAAVGHRIRVRRVEQKMKQSDLAEKVGMVSQHISQFERGERRIGIDHLVAIAKALDCSPSYLLRDFEHQDAA